MHFSKQEPGIGFTFFKQDHGQAVLIISRYLQVYDGSEWRSLEMLLKEIGEKSLTSVGENFPERGGWNSSLNEENVIKCLHRKTGEDYPLRELVWIKLFLKEKLWKWL